MPATPSRAHRLLLLIPAYNEEERIGPVLREFAVFYREHYAARFGIVVVLNGCVDNTLGVVQAVAAEYPEVSWQNFPGRIGKGGALIEGLKLAPEADLIGYVDADGATGPAAFLRLVELADEADCVIGSRWLEGAVLHQSQTWVRRRFSRVFHAIVELLFRMGIHDTQCPAKLIRRNAVMAIHDALQIADLAFDVNLLYALQRHGFRVLEVPIEWTDKMGSSVTRSLLRSSLVMFLSVVRLRLVYSPFRGLQRLMRPFEKWIYTRLKAPPPRTN